MSALAEVLQGVVETKRFLALQYAAWSSRAPAIEPGIALVGMAQEELGHAAALEGTLGGDAGDKDAVVSWRSWTAQVGAPVIESWPDMIATCLARDGSASATLEALQEASDAKLAPRVRKILQEEGFHSVFGIETLRGLAGLDAQEKARLYGVFRAALESAEASHAGGLEGQGRARREACLRRLVEQVQDALK